LAKAIFCSGLGFFLLLSALLIPIQPMAGITPEESGYLDRNFAGGRVGAWTNTGDESAPPESDFSLDFSKTSIFGAFFYLHRLKRFIAAEFSFGIYSRGEIKYVAETDTYLGSVNLYPIMLSMKLYPLSFFRNIPFHVYLQPGFGLVYGKQDVVDYIDVFGAGLVIAESRTKITYMLATGVDWPIARQIGLTMNFKYTPVKFGKPLAQIEDYSGWALTFGIGYIFRK
jgi:opacity protein-like surface antigen